MFRLTIALFLPLLGSAQIAIQQVLNNSAVEKMVRNGIPLPNILETIRTAREIDFLVDDYDHRQLMAAGATDRVVLQIFEAVHQRLIHGPAGAQAPSAPMTAIPYTPAVYTNAPASVEVSRGPELVNPGPIPQRLTLRQPGPAISLDDATPIRLRTTRNLSSSDAKTGDTVDFEVLEEVRVQDRIVIQKGAVAIGSVTNAEAKKRMARGGKLDVMIEFVKLADGEKAALRGVKESKGGGHTAGMTTGIVVTSLVFWPAAPMFLFMQGKDITIPKGTEITAYTNGNMNLDGGQFEYGPRMETGR